MTLTPHPIIERLRLHRIAPTHLRALAALWSRVAPDDVSMAGYVGGLYAERVRRQLPNPFAGGEPEHDAWRLAYENGTQLICASRTRGHGVSRPLKVVSSRPRRLARRDGAAKKSEEGTYMPVLDSRHLFDIQLSVSAPQMVGRTPFGDRRIVTITGGGFEGERIKGTVLAGGGDWLLGRPDGVLQLDVRLTLKTHDDALIYMTYRGMRHGPADVIARLNKGENVDPSEYYFRVTPYFETGSEAYGWLNRLCAVGTGDRRPDGPHYSVYEIL